MLKEKQQISKETLELLNKIENPTLKEITELSKKLQLDSMVLVEFFIKKESN